MKRVAVALVIVVGVSIEFALICAGQTWSVNSSLIKDLLTSGFAILTALVALSAFAPKLFENYATLAGQAAASTADAAAFRKQFGAQARRVDRLLPYLGIAYGMGASAVVVLLGAFVLSDVPCVSWTCKTSGVPVAAGLLVAACGAYLLCLGAGLLGLFQAVSRELMKKATK